MKTSRARWVNAGIVFLVSFTILALFFYATQQLKILDQLFVKSEHVSSANKQLSIPLDTLQQDVFGAYCQYTLCDSPEWEACSALLSNLHCEEPSSSSPNYPARRTDYRPTSAELAEARRQAIARVEREMSTPRSMYKDLSQATLWYNHFEKLQRGQRVNLRLVMNLEEEKISEFPATARGTPVERSLRSNQVPDDVMWEGWVIAKVEGSFGLDVMPTSDEEQRLVVGSPTIWQWEVKALAGGPQSLLIKMHADNDGLPVPILIYDEEVTVQVSTLQSVSDIVGEFGVLNGFLVSLLGAIATVLSMPFISRVWSGRSDVRADPE